MGAGALLGMADRRPAFADPGRRPASAGGLDDGTVEQRLAELDRALIDTWSLIGDGDREPAILTGRRGGAVASCLRNRKVCLGATESLSVLFEWLEPGFGQGHIVAGIRIVVGA